MYTATNNIPSSQIFSIDTLIFSKKMQKAGMSQKLSEQLAVNLKVMQFGFIENLLTKDEFRVFQKEVSFEIKDLRDNFKGMQNDIKDLKHDLKDLKNDMNALQKDMQEFKDEIRQDMQEFKDEIRQDMQEFKDEIRQDMREFKDEIREDMQEFKKEIKGEIENLVSKKEFYSEMKNLSLNLTIKMGVIMGAGIAIIGVITKI
jgi:uncharacterized protein YoxC